MVEISVRRQDRQLPVSRNGADQEIDARSGDSRSATPVRAPGRLLVLLDTDRLFLEGAQMLAQAVERLLLPDAGQDLLAYRSDQDRPAVCDELAQKVDSLSFSGIQRCSSNPCSANRLVPARRCRETAGPR